MPLSDKQIKKLCPGGSGMPKMVSPFIRTQEGFPSYGLGPFGYDIRLGNTIRIFKDNVLIDPSADVSALENTNEMHVFNVPIGQQFVVHPHTTVIVESLEQFRMPDDVMGWIVGKSTYTRLGLILSATVIEPGWRGRLKFAVINPTAARIKLNSGAGIAQVIFDNGEKPELSYSGRYQDQGINVDEPTSDNEEDEGEE